MVCRGGGSRGWPVRDPSARRKAEEGGTRGLSLLLVVTGPLLTQLLSLLLLLLLLLPVSFVSVGSSSVSEGSPDFTPEVELKDSEGILDSNTAWENWISQSKHNGRRQKIHGKNMWIHICMYFKVFKEINHFFKI